MLMPDINVLVYAFRKEMPDHARYHQWLSELVGGAASFGMADLVLSGFVRVVTQRPFDPPTPLDRAFDFCDGILASPACVRIRPGDQTWGMFEDLCRRTKTVGASTTDVYFAALAIEAGATWVTTDKDFAKFPGLTWCHAFGAQARTNPR